MAADTWTLPDAPPTAPPSPPTASTPPPIPRAVPPRGGAPESEPRANPDRGVPRSGRARTIVAILALVAVAGGAGGLVGASVAGDRATPDAAATGAGRDAAADHSRDGQLDVAAVLDAVAGAVADIQATGRGRAGQGTGIVYSAEGLVLTNAHVVEGASEVTVTTTGDRQARRATVVGTDADNDVAVLRLEDTEGLIVATLGRSADTRVGEDVVAIGNALGLRGDPSVTRGIVSALDRNIGNLTGVLQTDAAINSGNSGGPLVNAAAQVIGINTAIAVQSNAQNIGFAIPIDRAKAIADRLVRGEDPSPVAFLGVATRDNTAGTTGATIAEVTPDSPAAAAGLRPGDVVVAVGDDTVSGAASLSRLVAERAPGSAVELTIVRDGDERKVTATLGRR